MKIAVTYENGVVFAHFGKCAQFLLVNTDQNQIIEKTMLMADGAGHGALAALLRKAQADVVICGGIGEGARSALHELGIEVISGAKGNAEAAIDAYMKGHLHDDPSGSCHHHKGSHSCADHCHDTDGCHH